MLRSTVKWELLTRHKGNMEVTKGFVTCSSGRKTYNLAPPFAVTFPARIYSEVVAVRPKRSSGSASSSSSLGAIFYPDLCRLFGGTQELENRWNHSTSIAL